MVTTLFITQLISKTLAPSYGLAEIRSDEYTFRIADE